jgi:hypothetical protein
VDGVYEIFFILKREFIYFPFISEKEKNEFDRASLNVVLPHLFCRSDILSSKFNYNESDKVLIILNYSALFSRSFASKCS